MMIIRAKVHIMLVKMANREVPDQTASLSEPLPLAFRDEASTKKKYSSKY